MEWPKQIVPYMSGDQSFIAPIMSNPENVYQLGPNAYSKPATALNILRETVMGHDLFDHAFETYSKRWMFKHPTPEDFFRTMEDASAVDLDWFWRGWFYTTDYVDIGIKEVKKFHVSSSPNKEIRDLLKSRNLTVQDIPPFVYMVEEGSEDYNESLKGKTAVENATSLNEYLMDNFTPEERAALKQPKYFLEVTFNKPGGIPMPLIVEIAYKDGSTEVVKFPVQIWRKNDLEVTRVIASEKEISRFMVDPNEETADIDISNNSWPKQEVETDFEKFKNKNQN